MNRNRSTRSHVLIVCAFAWLVSAVPIAHAQICGDGDLNVGEQCDDGNLLDDDCCSLLCRLALAGTVCRASSDPCDPPETCALFDGFCPADTGITGDLDADGLCDALDTCPDMPDPDQIDRDDDGLGDPCDPCTNVYPGLIDNAKLRLRKLALAPGSQRVKFRGALHLPPGTAIAPAADGLRFMITDGAGRVSVDVSLPAGVYDPATRLGWKQIGGGTTWVYSDHAGSVGGIKKALVRSRTPAEAQFLIFGQDGNYQLPGTDPITATVVLAPPFAIDGQCAELQFPPDSCRFRNQESKLLCR
jgi:cysteine-rich repeat protein